MKNKIVVKDNALIDASFNLTLVEQRLMLLTIVEAREKRGLSPSTPIEITALSYSKQFKVDESTAYRNIASASKTLKRREFSYFDRYKDQDAITVAGWVNKVTYVKSTGLVALYLSEEVISMIKCLDEHFTQYYLDNVSEFDSKYSLRVYELVSKWRKVGHTEKYAYEDLRAKLGVELKEYKTMSLFKANVLDKALLELNEKSDLKIKYEQFRTGRSISHFSFVIKEKRVVKTIEAPVELTFKLTARQIELFASKLSRDHLFGSIYGAVGELQPDFENRLLSELANRSICQKYADHLIRLGYAESKRKAKAA